jgi:hypothetical protein
MFNALRSTQMKTVFDVLKDPHMFEKSALIQQLYASADPGTFANLDLLSFAELQELASMLEVAE